MARLVSGVLLVIWGLALLISFPFRVIGDGAYGFGQVMGGLVFGVLLLALGARAIQKGREARG